MDERKSWLRENWRIGLILVLIGPLAHVGIALATALSNWLNPIPLGLLLWRAPVAVLALVPLGVLLLVVFAWRTSGEARHPRGGSTFFPIGG